jgi:hypothetical protein
MANVTVDTTLPAYQNRHADFGVITAFWRPYLVEYFKHTPEQRAAWRANDPFLDDLLTFVKAVVDEREESL